MEQNKGDIERDTEREDALFINLLLMFKAAAMQQMGKLMNPLTEKVEKNLEQARFSIDILAMLKEKTKGNLSQDLEKLMDSVLLELLMNYVEEAEGEEKGAGEKPEGAEAEAGQEDTPSEET